jgi:opacity protein-like surface antigen
VFKQFASSFIVHRLGKRRPGKQGYFDMNRKDFTRKHALALATIGFAPLAALGNLSLPALGADYGAPIPAPAPTYDMVEFASGWYVRGDVAYAQETFPKIAPDFAFGGTQSVVNGYSVGTGFGYKVNDWFRTDLVFDFRDRVRSAGIGAPGPCILKIGSNTCYFDTTIERLDLLANGYLDLGTWQGFTPLYRRRCRGRLGQNLAEQR